MEKVVYLLMGPGDVAGSAHAPGLTNGSVRASVVSDLASRGASRIQINVFDPFLGHPFGVAPDPDVPHLAAMISLWVDAAEGSKVGAALPDPSEIRGDWHGYLVCEAEPLRNTTHPAAVDGRVPGFCQLVALTRPGHIGWGEWRRIWQGSHTSVALNTQSTFRYVQNLVFRALTPGAPPYAAVVEECFPAEAATDLHVFFDAAGDDAKLARHMAAISESCDRFMSGSDPVSWTTEWLYSD